MPRFVKPRKGYIKRGDRFVARMTVDSKQVHIGTYDTEEAAREAYLTARSEVFSEQAVKKARDAGLTHYMPDAPCKNGHTSRRSVSQNKCLECFRIKAATRVDKKKAAENARKYRADMPAEKKKVNDAVAAERSREWRKANKGHHTALTTMHRKAVKQRTPAWAKRESIVEIYKGCPPGHHVDHIIPLRGRTVSGLHVEGNLQYLTARENIVKHNKYSSDAEFV